MATATKKEKVGKRAGVVSRILKFLREVRRELGKVFWPSRTEVVSYTMVVLVAVTIVAVLIWVVDSAVTEILKLVLVR